MRGLSAYEMLCARGLVSGCSVNGLGGLGALGQASALNDPKNSYLANPTTGQFSNELFESAKRTLYGARDAAWTALNAAKAELQKMMSAGGDRGARARDALSSLDRYEFADLTRLNAQLDAGANDLNNVLWSRKPAGMLGNLINRDAANLAKLPKPYVSGKTTGYTAFEGTILNYALLVIGADEAIARVAGERPGWFSSVSSFVENVRDWPKAWAGGAQQIKDKYRKGELKAYMVGGGFFRDLVDGTLPDAAIVDLVTRIKTTKNSLNALKKVIDGFTGASLSSANKATLDTLKANYTARYAQYQGYLYSFWALPSFAAEFKRQGVRAPDTAVAIQASAVAKKIHDGLKAQGMPTQLSGLGIDPLTVKAVAVVVVALTAAYIASCYTDMEINASNNEVDIVKGNQIERQKAIDCIAAGTCPKETLDKVTQTQQTETEKRKEDSKGPLDFMQYLPWIVGGVAVIALLPTITSLTRGAAAATGTAGLGRAPRQRRLRF
jgi:hypothetical protein